MEWGEDIKKKGKPQQMCLVCGRPMEKENMETSWKEGKESGKVI